jgi:hypothetical protein
MDVEINPEPKPEEREAIEVALRRLVAPAVLPAAYTSAWRKAAVAIPTRSTQLPGRAGAWAPRARSAVAHHT